ncbi:MAG: DUF262 domain-containing protein [Bacteroidales bacterium]|nr:DUF262 domain-containing protein [Bacteroidales bacterium]
MASKNFDSTQIPLKDLLENIGKQELQLPDFQRSWVWDNYRIKSLLASISVSFPIGAIMLLETGNPDVKFKTKPLKGITPNGNDPEELILDGQQRLTALYQSITYNKVVETVDQKGKKISRWYYIDIEKALTGEDMEDAIIDLPEDKKITKDFGREVVLSCETENDEYKNFMFPLTQIFDDSNWFNGFMNYWNYDQEKIKFFQKFQQQIINQFKSYNVPVIKLFKNNPKEAVCQVFEKVNTGGVSLDVFELLTATFAADDFRLRDDWEERSKQTFQEFDILNRTEKSDFLQVVSLLLSYEKRKKAIEEGKKDSELPAISCKRKTILKLEKDEYLQWADKAEKGFAEAARLLFGQKIFKAYDLPYTAQLVPLAALFGYMGDEIKTEGAKQKILKWYWNGIFGELYGGANETRYARDFPELMNWIKGSETEPTTIRDAYFAEDRLETLRTRNSAAYKGLFILQMQKGAKDFITGDEIQQQNYFEDAVDIHHIFPRAWCIKNGIEESRYNTIINKTPLAKRTNTIIGGNAPSTYLNKVLKRANISNDELTQILTSHYIEKNYLENDDFEGFYQDRKEQLINAIEYVTNKKVQRLETS